MADMWKSICTFVSILQYHAPILHYSIFCMVNSANSSRFDHEPPSSRPVQGQVPRDSTELLDLSSRKVASGQSSHQKPPNHNLQHHILHMAFSHFLTLFLSCFRTLRPGIRSLFLSLAFVPPLHGLPTHPKNLRTGTSPPPHRSSEAQTKI
jgi:hypothetical protein